MEVSVSDDDSPQTENLKESERGLRKGKPAYRPVDQVSSTVLEGIFKCPLLAILVWSQPMG
jgi:hypothetical protein